MTIRRTAAVAVLLIALISGGTPNTLAQTPRLAVTQFGMDIAGVGDIDGDGIGDLVATSYGGASTIPGRVAAFSGLDGQLLFVFNEDTPIAITTGLPSVSACGDADGDGVPDFAISSMGVALVSGVDGTLIRTYEGQLFAGIGDVDGDGRGDLVIGGPAVAAGVYPVRIRSGKDGSCLLDIRVDLSVLSPPLFAAQITHVARTGDISGDGNPDFAVRGIGGFPPGSKSLFRVYDGQSGQLIIERLDLPVFSRGVTVAPAGDLDGDGRGELFVAVNTIFGQAGVLISGWDGATLQAYIDPQLTSTAQSVVAPGDIDRDGVVDVVFGSVMGGAPPVGSGRISVFSGADGSIITSSLGPQPSYGFGTGLAAIGDTDGDGLGDFAVGTSPTTPSVGIAKGLLVYSSRSQPVEPIGTVYSSAASSEESDVRPVLSMAGSLGDHSLVIARLANGPPSSMVFLLAGTTLLDPGPILDGLPIPGNATVFLLAVDVVGRAELTGRWPASVPAGFTLYLRALNPTPPLNLPSNLLRLIAP